MIRMIISLYYILLIYSEFNYPFILFNSRAYLILFEVSIFLLLIYSYSQLY